MYILVKETKTITGNEGPELAPPTPARTRERIQAATPNYERNKGVLFKIYTPFPNCI